MERKNPPPQLWRPQPPVYVELHLFIHSLIQSFNHSLQCLPSPCDMHWKYKEGLQRASSPEGGARHEAQLHMPECLTAKWALKRASLFENK